MSRTRSHHSTDEMVRMYESGMSLNEIAPLVGLTGSGVRHRLIRAGVPMRGRGQPRRPDVDTDDLARLYESGMSSNEIGRAVGMSGESVLARLHGSGTELRKYGWRNRLEIDSLKAVRLYRSGMSCTKVAKALGCSHSTVLRRVVEAGEQVRPLGTNGNTSGVSTAELVRLYESGIPSTEIAAEVGMTAGGVLGRLKKAGYEVGANHRSAVRYAETGGALR